jgi:hypothetical protein
VHVISAGVAEAGTANEKREEPMRIDIDNRDLNFHMKHHFFRVPYPKLRENVNSRARKMVHARR